jgi:DnaJ-class molecular chaperone
MKKSHKDLQDRSCPRCHLIITPPVPHECDPTLCVDCDATGRVWLGRVDGTWIGKADCPRCKGTGRIRFNDDNAITVG